MEPWDCAWRSAAGGGGGGARSTGASSTLTGRLLLRRAGHCAAVAGAGSSRRGLGAARVTLELLVLTGSLLFVATSLLQTRCGFGEEPCSRALIAEETAGARFFFKRFQALYDRDGDGYAPVWGRDCTTTIPMSTREPKTSWQRSRRTAMGKTRRRRRSSRPPPRPRPKPAVAMPSPSESVESAQRGSLCRQLADHHRDTLRADRMEVAPVLAELRGAVRSTQVYAQAPNTPRSFPFLTSRLPSEVHFVKQSLNFRRHSRQGRDAVQCAGSGGRDALWRVLALLSRNQTNFGTGFAEWQNPTARNLKGLEQRHRRAVHHAGRHRQAQAAGRNRAGEPARALCCGRTPL